MQFSNVTTPAELKFLILLYTPEKKVYLGFIPHDQVGFVERLRKVIQARKIQSIQQRQVQVRIFDFCCCKICPHFLPDYVVQGDQKVLPIKKCLAKIP